MNPLSTKLISSVSTFSSSQPVPACSAQATSRPFIDILSIHFGSPSFGPGYHAIRLDLFQLPMKWNMGNSPSNKASRSIHRHQMVLIPIFFRFSFGFGSLPLPVPYSSFESRPIAMRRILCRSVEESSLCFLLNREIGEGSASPVERDTLQSVTLRLPSVSAFFQRNEGSLLKVRWGPVFSRGFAKGPAC